MNGSLLERLYELRSPLYLSTSFSFKPCESSPASRKLASKQFDILKLCCVLSLTEFLIFSKKSTPCINHRPRHVHVRAKELLPLVQSAGEESKRYDLKFISGTLEAYLLKCNQAKDRPCNNCARRYPPVVCTYEGYRFRFHDNESDRTITSNKLQ